MAKSKKSNPAVERARKEAKKALEVARKDAKAALAKAKAKFKEAEKHLDKKIQSHPEQAVLVAGAIGAAVGGLVAYSVLKNKKK